MLRTHVAWEKEWKLFSSCDFVKANWNFEFEIALELLSFFHPSNSCQEFHISHKWPVRDDRSLAVVAPLIVSRLSQFRQQSVI